MQHNFSSSGKEKEGRRGEDAPAHKCCTTLAQLPQFNDQSTTAKYFNF